jgi:hypothetical protein
LLTVTVVRTAMLLRPQVVPASSLDGDIRSFYSGFLGGSLYLEANSGMAIKIWPPNLTFVF